MMMLMLPNKTSDSSNDQPKPADQMAQMMKMAEMFNSTKKDSVVPPPTVIDQAVAGPSGYTFPATGGPGPNLKKETSPPSSNIGGSFHMKIPPKKLP